MQRADLSELTVVSVLNINDVQFGFALPIFQSIENGGTFVQRYDPVTLEVLDFEEYHVPESDLDLLVEIKNSAVCSVGDLAFFAFLDLQGLMHPKCSVHVGSAIELNELFYQNMAVFARHKNVLTGIAEFIGRYKDLSTNNDVSQNSRFSWEQFVQKCTNDQALPYSYIPYPYSYDIFSGEEGKLPEVYRRYLSALKVEAQQKAGDNGAWAQIHHPVSDYAVAIGKSERGIIPLVNVMWATKSRMEHHIVLKLGEFSAFSVITQADADVVLNLLKQSGCTQVEYNKVRELWRKESVAQRIKTYKQNAIPLSRLIGGFANGDYHLSIQADSAILEHAKEIVEKLEIIGTGRSQKMPYSDFGEGLREMAVRNDPSAMVAEWSPALEDLVATFPNGLDIEPYLIEAIESNLKEKGLLVFKGYVDDALSAGYMLPKNDPEYSVSIAVAVKKAFYNEKKKDWNDHAKKLFSDMMMVPERPERFLEQYRQTINLRAQQEITQYAP